MTETDNQPFGTQVLCTTRYHLKALGEFQGLAFGKKYDALLSKSHTLLVPRKDVETDPGFQQIIPYVILFRRTVFGLEVLTYVRTNGSDENRLHGKASIGFGGHLECREISEEVNRELREELRTIDDDPIELLRYYLPCYLKDDSNPVGQVHLGLVILAEVVPGQELASGESKIEVTGWVPVAELKQNPNWETWSQICVDNMNELLNHSGIVK